MANPVVDRPAPTAAPKPLSSLPGPRPLPLLATLARNYELIEVGTADGRESPEHLAFTMFPVGLKLRVAMRR